MGKQFGEALKDIIGYIAWKLYLWSIGITAKQYWYEIYKQERDRMCVDRD